MLKRWELWWVGLGYFACTLLLTLPFVLQRHVLFGDGDVWQVLWNFWWAKTALATHSNIFFTTYLHWPGGISLVFHTLSLANSIPAVFLQYVFGLVGALHIIIYLHFVLTGVAMYVFVRYLTQSRFAAFAAGYLFTFSQYHMMRSQGHLNLFAMEGIPLYMYFLFRLRETLSWKYAMYAALALAYAGFADLQYLLYLFLFTLLYLFYALWQPAGSAFIKRAVVMAGIAAVLLAPLLCPLLYQKYASHDHDVYGHDPLVYSVDLESFFIPGAYSLYEQQTFSVWSAWTGYWESPSYLGYSIVLLSLLVLYWQRKKTLVWFWFAVAAVFLILSLGPYLHIGGATHRNIPLPYIVMLKLPLLSLGGVVMRFSMMGIMALTILAAMAFAEIQTRFRKGHLIALMCFVVVIAELFPAPIVTSPLDVPEFYQILINDPATYAIMDFSHDAPKVLYYQTLHHKPLIGGYTSRPTISTQTFLRTTPVISDLFNDQYRYQHVAPPINGKEVLKNLQIKYVLVPLYHRPLRKYVEAMGLRLVYKKGDMMAYQVF